MKNHKRTALAGTITLLLSANTAFAATTICVDQKPNSPCKHYIQEAIDAAASGDTVKIAAGIYNESLTVNKQNLTITGAGCSTRLEACASNYCGNTGITVSATGVTIQKIAIGHAAPAININNNNPNTTITGNCFYDNDTDITGTVDSPPTTVSKNLFTGGRGSSINLSADGVTVMGNKLNGYDDGISITGYSPIVDGNTLTDGNDGGISVTGYNAKITNNKISSADGDSGSIEVFGDKPTIDKNTLSNTYSLYVSCPDTNSSHYGTCTGGTITNNKISHTFNDARGIDARGHLLTVSNNTIDSTGEDGIFLTGDGNTVSKNKISNNGTESGYHAGIRVKGSSNTIDQNSISKSRIGGINNYAGDSNTYTKNIITQSARSGFVLTAGSGNTLDGNKIMASFGGGISNNGTSTNITNNTVKGNKIDLCKGFSGNFGTNTGNNIGTGSTTTDCQVDSFQP